MKPSKNGGLRYAEKETLERRSVARINKNIFAMKNGSQKITSKQNQIHEELSRINEKLEDILINLNKFKGLT